MKRIYLKTRTGLNRGAPECTRRVGLSIRATRVSPWSQIEPSHPIMLTTVSKIRASSFVEPIVYRVDRKRRESEDNSRGATDTTVQDEWRNIDTKKKHYFFFSLMAMT